MNENTKTFEVTLSTGEVKTVSANEVQETANRVKFLGYVPGHTHHGSEVVESFRSELVDSYRLVPVPEKNAKAEGANVYRFNFEGGQSKEVRGDYVTHTPGADGKPGRYSVVTRLRQSNDRTEYVVSEDGVADIERVTDVVPAQAKVSKAKA